MNLNIAAGLLTTLALFVPVLLILVGRLFTNTSLFTLALYYLLNLFCTLLELDVIKLSILSRQQAVVIFNYLDTPLMLVVLLFFCNQRWQRAVVLVMLALMLCFEIYVAVWLGMAVKSSTYILGPGTLLIFVIAIYFFFHYGKRSIVQGKGTGKTLMLVGVLFSYGAFLVLYFLHFLVHTTAVADEYLVYYVSQLISASLISAGLVYLVKRAREIQELQLTRRELALFFDT